MATRGKIRPIVLFLHVGWARDYRGAPDDEPVGKFGFMREGNRNSGEALNFRPYRGRCYGYAPHHSMNLEKLGAHLGAEHVDRILVIWTATDPARGGSYIVGWYRNARVYSELVDLRPDRKRPEIIAEAAARDCHVVPVDERTFFVPRMVKGWPGIANAFYATETLSSADLDKVLAYAEGKKSIGFYGGTKVTGAGDGHRGSGRGRPPVDPARNAEVERAAVDVVIQHYASQKWHVDSVEKENRGWDLTISRGGRELLVEVKGRDGEGAVELTPNEYRAMGSAKIRMSYRLAVVWNARAKEPRLTVFQYAPASNRWVSSGGAELILEEKVAAIASFRPARRRKGST